MVSKYIGPALLESIDPKQLELSPIPQLYMPSFQWCIPGRKQPKGLAVAQRCLYRKAFDLVDHNILAAKILGLRIPRGIARWVCDFLVDKSQRVKLSSDCLSEWGTVPSGVPQWGRKTWPLLPSYVYKASSRILCPPVPSRALSISSYHHMHYQLFLTMTARQCSIWHLWRTNA